MYATADDFLEQYQNDETVRISNQHRPDELKAKTRFIETALTKSEGMSLTYLGAYKHPIANPPKYLTYAICAIARKEMERHNHRDSVLRDYDDALRWLVAIGKGAPLMRDNGAPVELASAAESASSIVGGNVGMGEAAVGRSYGESILTQSFINRRVPDAYL